MFISLEGPDGAGKTTQIRLLADRLQKEGSHVVTTREPGGTALGQELRALLLSSGHSLTAASEAFLMSADRAEHVEHVIRPALALGKLVITDRYLDSTLAYQGGGRGLDMDALRVVQQLATGGLEPDLTLLLDLPVQAGLERKLLSVDLNRLDHESREFHEAVAATFRDLAQQNPRRWRTIDATQDVQMVHTAIWLHVSAHLEERRAALVRGDIA